jgi:hypothetical protein
MSCDQFSSSHGHDSRMRIGIIFVWYRNSLTTRRVEVYVQMILALRLLGKVISLQNQTRSDVIFKTQHRRNPEIRYDFDHRATRHEIMNPAAALPGSV